MAYIQLIEPNINISARAGMCLEYVDNAVNAPKRTATAQIAYETAKGNGWVSANTEMPRGLWSVLFWSIDNGEYAGLGHVALVYVNDQGQMEIHDSEVHAGARQPYGSLQELDNWFGSAGTRLTFLGWSIGVDGRKIIEDYTPPKLAPTGEKPKTKTKKGELMLLFKEKDGKIYFLLGNTYTYVGTPKELNKIKVMMNKAGYDTWEHTDPEQIKYLKRLAKNV